MRALFRAGLSIRTGGVASPLPQRWKITESAPCQYTKDAAGGSRRYAYVTVISVAHGPCSLTSNRTPRSCPSIVLGTRRKNAPGSGPKSRSMLWMTGCHALRGPCITDFSPADRTASEPATSPSCASTLWNADAGIHEIASGGRLETKGGYWLPASFLTGSAIAGSTSTVRSSTMALSRSS